MSRSGEASGLARRSVAVSDEARQRIMSCVDLELLETWGDRAVTADTVEDVFA
jgi:hypothetical protein